MVLFSPLACDSRASLQGVVLDAEAEKQQSWMEKADMQTKRQYNMIYEMLISIPKVYLVALGKRQNKQTNKNICLDLERVERRGNAQKRQPCNW